MKKFSSLAAILALGLGYGVAADAANLTFSAGRTGDSSSVFRLGAQFDFDRSWWETSTGRLTGYWDAGYTYWEGHDGVSAAHSVSFAPVFVYEFAGDSVKPFIEAGIGIAGFSKTRVAGSNLGSAFEFEDRIGAGLRFNGGHTVGVRAIHYSNAGIKDPNDGVESYSLYYQMAF